MRNLLFVLCTNLVVSRRMMNNIMVEMVMRKIVVVVEEVEAAKTALQWALHNLLLCGDLIILVYVFPSSSSSSSTRHNNNNNNSTKAKRQRLNRLKGFQLALSFKHLCDTMPDAKVEIIVREGDKDGRTIASIVREMGASALVLGLHDHSFIHRMMMPHASITDSLNCRILAIKQTMVSLDDKSVNLDFSQIETFRLSVPVPPPQKIPYPILPSPFGIIWGSRRRKTSN